VGRKYKHDPAGVENAGVVSAFHRGAYLATGSLTLLVFGGDREVMYKTASAIPTRFCLGNIHNCSNSGRRVEQTRKFS